jgi:hypothetical protein
MWPCPLGHLMCGIWMEDILENSGKNIIKIMKGKFDLFFPKM